MRYYPECMRHQKVRPGKIHMWKALSFPDNIHLGATSASKFTDGDGHEGWYVKGIRDDGAYSNPKFKEFVQFVGMLKVDKHKINVYEWRGQLWVRATRGPSKGYSSGGRIPADVYKTFPAGRVQTPTTSGITLDITTTITKMVGTYLLPIDKDRV